MKKLFIIMVCILFTFTGCSSPAINQTNVNIIENTNINDTEYQDSFDFTGLNDEDLLTYVKDRVYMDTIKELDSEEYVVEEVKTCFVSKEYLEELEYNSKPNIFFGYTLDELDDYFDGDRYIFTLSENGETTVEKLQEIKNTDSIEMAENVLIGSGIIVVAVTVSVVAPAVGAPTAITAIFTVSANTATSFAVGSSVFSGVTAGIVEGYKTGDVKKAFNSALVSSTEGFKWGAISGAVIGGGSEAFLLKAGTKGGLTMSEVATIQHESLYPMEIIERLGNKEQYSLFKEIGLKSTLINNKTALVRNIDLNYVDDATGLTNLQLMQRGNAPFDPTGNRYELHHIGQRNDSPLAILTRTEHDNSFLHTLTENFDNPSNQNSWQTIKSNFWKSYAKWAERSV